MEGILTGAVLWGLVGLCLVLVVAFPALVAREWQVIVPWPLPACGATAGLARAYGVFPDAAGYLAIATIALAVTVAIDVFTPVELSSRFVVVFAVLSTLAVQALWRVDLQTSGRPTAGRAALRIRRRAVRHVPAFHRAAASPFPVRHGVSTRQSYHGRFP